MTTIGPDYASVDKNAKPDFGKAKAAGARFVFVRGVYGRDASGEPYLDPCWERDKDAIVAAGLKRTAYMYICYPKAGSKTPLPDDQAQAFIDYVHLVPGKDMVPVIDIEQESTLTAAAMYEWSRVIARRLRDHYGAWPAIYTSARVWSENLDSHPPGELLNCPLWLAKPWPWKIRSPVHLDGAPAYSPTTIPEFGNAWMFYQYQGDAIDWPGFSSTVDASRCRAYGIGARGQQVMWTQHRLGITADGIFGPKTEQAVKDFQRAHGLSIDGIVGLNTYTPLAWQNS